MMARTKRARRVYSAGEWGWNRVRIFTDPRSGIVQVESAEDGRRLTGSLKHRDWRRAKRQTHEFTAGFAGPVIHRKPESEPLTPTRGRTGSLSEAAGFMTGSVS